MKQPLNLGHVDTKLDKDHEIILEVRPGDRRDACLVCGREVKTIVKSK